MMRPDRGQQRDARNATEVDFYAFLATIDEHHGTYATPTAWAVIHVRGVAIEQVAAARIATELGDVPFRILPEPGGFAIIRTAPQA